MTQLMNNWLLDTGNDIVVFVCLFFNIDKTNYGTKVNKLMVLFSPLILI